jgi:ATP-dependent Lhr-like helicase
MAMARIRMTSLRRSNFELLSEPVRKWVWKQEWPSLRDVQEKAIPVILAGGDVVVSAKTAAGKTEAALLPLLTRLRDREEGAQGFSILYVSPLKALINDQFRRLEGLCEACDVVLNKWHGDVSADAKARARKRPSGAVLITPESLEALLVRRGHEIKFLFSSLEAVVIDELHAFIGTERGMQLSSILDRIEVACGRDRIDRIGLSATLGDMGLAAEALRPGYGSTAKQVHGLDAGNDIKLQVRGYLLNAREPDTEGMDDADPPAEASDDGPTPDDQIEAEEVPGVHPKIADDLFRFLRGDNNLLFAGSRQKVELYADKLRRMCDDGRLHNEFFAHHGSLSKAEREDVETRLRDDPRPATAVATTTLELGIDIGDVHSVAQIGPGYSVASLRQRLGRSGRRPGNPAILRVFVAEPVANRGGHPIDRLNLDLVQSIAMVECLRDGWCEPPAAAGLHLSTLIHQLLSLILQTGGIKPLAAWEALCSRGPFKTVDRGLFAELLRCMASPENRLIEQSSDRSLMIGEVGEKITESHEFYPVFVTEREYRIIHETRMLGTYPLTSPLASGETLIFAGRRWRILEIDDRARAIAVQPTKRGKPPYFAGDGGSTHDVIVRKMRDVLSSREAYVYVDRTASALLADAREAFAALGLVERMMVEHGDGVLVFPWVGTKKLLTLSLALLAGNFQASHFKHTLEVQACTADGLRSKLSEIASGSVTDGETIAARMAKPHMAKFDHFLTPELMNRVTLKERLDVESLPSVAQTLI